MKNLRLMKGFAVFAMVLLLSASLLAEAAGMGTGAALAIVGIGMGAAAFLPAIGDVTAMGISQEIWAKSIEENLFPDNSFIMTMTDESEYVNDKTVHNPNAGAIPTVTINQAYPVGGGAGATTTQRTDVTQDWNIDEYNTNPFVISNAEEVELSYSKVNSVLYETNRALETVIGDNCLIKVAATGTGVLPDTTTNNNILRSSGITNGDAGDVRSSAAYMPGATGSRLNFTMYDVKAAKKLFDTQNIPAQDRYMLVSAEAADQLIIDLMATKYRSDVGNVFNSATGSIDSLLGFKIITRSRSAVYTNDELPQPKAYGAAGAAADNDAILFWHKSFVAKARGDVRVFEQLNSPVQYGDVYSALVRFGATKKRPSELGVGAIVQSAA